MKFKNQPDHHTELDQKTFDLQKNLNKLYRRPEKEKKILSRVPQDYQNASRKGWLGKRIRVQQLFP